MDKTDQELIMDAINHLRAATESISKLRTSSVSPSNTSLNSGSSPVSILAERCRNGVQKCFSKDAKINESEWWYQKIDQAKQANDTKTLNLILGQLLTLYRS